MWIRDLERAVIRRKSLSFSSYLYCRYSSVMETVSKVACDCSSSDSASGSACYAADKAERAALSIGKMCPYESTTFTAHLTIVSSSNVVLLISISSLNRRT